MQFCPEIYKFAKKVFFAVNFFVSKRMNLWRGLKKAKQSFHSGGKT